MKKKRKKEPAGHPPQKPAPSGLAGQILEELKQLNGKLDRMAASHTPRGVRRPRGERNIFGEEEE